MITLGVFAGSTAWWIVLTSAIAVLRSRVTPRWLRTVNIVSGITIGALAILSIVAAVRG